MEAREMNTSSVEAHRGVFQRLLILYGLYTLLFNIFFVLAYYFLPEGFMRGSPQMAAGEVVASASSFWSQFGLTLLFNLCLMGGMAVLANFIQVKGIPLGYLIPPVLAVVQGLIVGTNSFVADNLNRYSNVREAMALGTSIGGVETLGLLLIISSTVGYGVYHYRSWWSGRGEWSPTRVMRLRDVRLSRVEILGLVLGILLTIVAAYRETAMPVSL
jgi:hypothetical protein